MTALPRYARVLVDAPLAQPLDYRVPAGALPALGQRCLVPLGRRKVVGLIVGFAEESNWPDERIKPLAAIDDEVAPLSADWLELTRFAADYYQQSWGEAALPALPGFLRTTPGPRALRRRPLRAKAAGPRGRRA